MKLIVDMWHPAGVNFYKNAIRILGNEYCCNPEFLVLRRGRLIQILQKECPDVPFTVIGQHKTSMLSKILDLARRDLRVLYHLRHREFSVATCIGGLSISPVAWLLRKPSVIFEDDIDPRAGFWLYRHFSTRVVLPSHIPVNGRNIFKYSGFKELAYLHPNYFEPQKESLKRYGLENCDFVFIREVSSSSLNYRDLVMGQLSKICPYLKALGFKIVLSLEEKSLREQFEEECIILEEPVEDIFSLLHFATLTISSGDTMARESCMLGTPVIYTGGREMAINKELERKGCFFKVEGESQILGVIMKIIEDGIKKQTIEAITYAIQYEWEDTTKVIVDNLLEVANQVSREAGS